ncbi:testis-expressed protein 2-like [Dunckerocampus dactyliophorus]|uniref:testis-expressed protein 2-like n=1 Tax=Dunckerocampus dactyliophorus TaxID=161453 RepID=UPI002406CAA6|nr:testis-expressed protein 2-like [Dunckerocampus dactyliophorus]
MANMEESKLILNMDNWKGPSAVFSKDKPPEEPSPSQHPQTVFLLPYSPPSPGSLADQSASSASTFLPNNLVKSSPADPTLKEGGFQKGKTMHCRSPSTEVNLIKPDPKVVAHPQKQTKISEAKLEPSVETPLSAICRSSMMEDQWKEYLRASQEFRSMMNQTVREESPVGPFISAVGNPPSYQGIEGKENTDLKCLRRADGGGCDTSLRRRQRSSLSEQRRYSRDTHLEIHTYSDTIKVVVHPNSCKVVQHRVHHQSGGTAPGVSSPIHWLLVVGLVAYGFFMMPMPSYVTGVSVGVAFGVILGLVLVFMLTAQWSTARGKSHYSRPRNRCPPDEKITDPETLEGWMTHTCVYNLETFQPSAAHPVYVGLERSKLRLSYPQTVDGTPQDSKFLRSCVYQLANCTVTLAPTGLARKRVWNKKYPICITLAEGEKGEESVMEGQEVDERAKRNIIVPVHDTLPDVLYLFANTGREKQEWFQHFQSASRMTAERCANVHENKISDTSQRDAAKDCTEELQNLPEPVKAATKKPLDYNAYMTHLVGSESSNPAPDPGLNDKGNPTADQKVDNEVAVAESSADTGPEPNPAPEGQPVWLNSLIGRILWNCLQDQYWTDRVAQKFQKKLSKIKLPYFMNELMLVDLDMGTCLPQILSISKPTLDRRGLWLEVQLVYTGCFQMTLQTKMNLCKLGKEDPEEPQTVPQPQQEGNSSSKRRLSTLADSDEESPSAGSSDEEDTPPAETKGSVGDKTPVVAPDISTGGSTGRKILKFVDKIAKSKYFQKATENEYIRKKIAEVSNVPLMLSVEVVELTGTLAINIPPPPTDRLWYGFLEPPKLDLHVRPMFGEREVTFTQVTEWIDKKLKCEFQKVLVMPNMDDLYVPLMASGPDNPPAAEAFSHHSRQSSMEHQD